MLNAGDWTQGRLCFQTSLQRLAEMVESGQFTPVFPSLHYSFEASELKARAQVREQRIEVFRVGAYPTKKCQVARLRELLGEHGVSMTGNKKMLVDKLAKLAARQYEARRDELDAYFSEHRFIRINAVNTGTCALPVLENTGDLRNLLLAMYCMMHLRGSAILDASHENDAYTAEALALALVRGEVSLTGSFLRAA